MVSRLGWIISFVLMWQVVSAPPACAQEAPAPGSAGVEEPGPEGQQGPPRGFRRRGFGPPPGFGGEERKLRRQFDADGNGWLDQEERKQARAESPPAERGFGGRGGPGRGFGGPGRNFDRQAPKQGRSLNPDQAKALPDADLYDPSILRTLFIDFEGGDWEEELEAFHNSDVEVPATLTVDGKQYQQVGVHFRGQSSYMMVPRGYMRSLNLSLDFVRKEQNLHGYRTLNLLNANGDASLMSSILYSEIARKYLPAPKVNFVHVVINGESWGVYVNAQQYNKDFLKENFKTTEGTRWKVDGSPMGDGGLRYLGEEIEPYRERFTIKSKENEAAWRRLIELCRTLDQTPAEELEEKLDGLLDVDSVLWFLALDVALVNSDGYWVRASDYSLYLDPDGCFHLIPHDMNEAFRSGGGPGRGFRPRRGRPEGEPRDRPPREKSLNEKEPPAPEGPPRFGPPPQSRRDGDPPREEFPFGPGRPPFGGPGGPPQQMGVKLDPLVSIDDARMPLRSKLLNVPELRIRYLQHVRQIAEESLDWDQLAPKVDAYRRLIEAEIDQETRRLIPASEFHAAVGPTEGAEPPHLEKFVKERREFLLKRTEELLQEAQ